MFGRNKRFDNNLKQKHDPVGKKLAAEIMRDLTGAKLVTENHKEDRGDFTDGFWDQLYELPSGKQVMVEPEMKDKKWWGESVDIYKPFKYDDVDIPYRKAKNSAHIHLVISTCERYAFVVTKEAMEKHLAETGGTPKFKKTIYEPSGASYYSTPVEKGFFVKKCKDGHWHRWKAGLQ